MSNRAYAVAMVELRRSNKAGPHPTARRKGTRKARKTKAINDSREGS